MMAEGGGARAGGDQLIMSNTYVLRTFGQKRNDDIYIPFLKYGLFLFSRTGQSGRGGQGTD